MILLFYGGWEEYLVMHLHALEAGYANGSSCKRLIKQAWECVSKNEWVKQEILLRE